MLGHRDADIRLGHGGQREGAQYFQACHEGVPAVGVLAHVGDFLEHGGHRAAFDGADGIFAMRAGQADDSHFSFLSTWYRARPRPVMFFDCLRKRDLTSHSAA